MKNQIVYILPGIFLLINAWYDIRKRKILLHSIWIFTVLWILFLMFVDKEKIWQAFGGILPGMFLLASAYALLFCSVVSAVMLVCKKRTYKTGVPFVPYLIAGYLCTFL